MAPDDRGKESQTADAAGQAGQPKRSPAAERALAEAAARRRAQPAAERPAEQNGRGGLDPTRYGDWEKNGIASDSGAGQATLPLKSCWLFWP